MHNRNEESRSLAAFALGTLTFKDSSVEAAVRSVLRIASLRNHTRWLLWAELQLTELVDEDTAKETIRPLLERQFPERARQDDLLDGALQTYLDTRRSSDDTSSYYLADISDIEQDLPIYEASLLREITVDHLAQRDLRHRILNRVKNQAQRYLMEIEGADQS